jgi:murein L,D-transpeptidase YafK
MQTHNLKLPKIYRNTKRDYYIKVRIVLIAVLIMLNVALLILFLQEIKNNRNALQIMQEVDKTLALLDESLSGTDMQKTFVHLGEARRQIAAAFPPAPIKRAPEPPGQTPQTAKTADVPNVQPIIPQAVEQKGPAVPVRVEPKVPAAPVKTTAVVIPVGETPAPLVWATPDEYALIGEIESNLLHLFKFQDGRFVLVKSYPCIIGANSANKKKVGDFAMPKGSYFTLSFTPASALSNIEKEGAFDLNYPNFLDRKDRKNGAGSWIHGHVPGKIIGAEDIVNTKGCITVSNDNIKELKERLKSSGTSVSIVDKVRLIKEDSRKESFQEIRTFMDEWRQAWESGDTEKYLSYYSKDFVNSEGVGFEAFKRNKERINSSKKFIRVKVDQMAVIFPQEREGQIAVVRFIQKYRSNNFENNSMKLFYLKKGRGGWTIFGESAF